MHKTAVGKLFIWEIVLLLAFHFLMKAVGGISHRIRDGLIEIERIGMNNNKPPIAQHIAQRVEGINLLDNIRQKIRGFFTQTAY